MAEGKNTSLKYGCKDCYCLIFFYLSSLLFCTKCVMNNVAFLFLRNAYTKLSFLKILGLFIPVVIVTIVIFDVLVYNKIYTT